MKTLPVALKRMHPLAPIPHYARADDAGADLITTEDFVLEPGQRRMVPTGIAIAMPAGWVGLIHPRSGLAAQHGVSMVNAPGTIDAGYRGEIKVLLINTDRETPVEFSAGERVAQLVFQEVAQATFEEVAELPESERATSGFGSSGR